MRTVRFVLSAWLLGLCACISYAQKGVNAVKIERALNKQLLQAENFSHSIAQSKITLQTRLANLFRPSQLVNPPIYYQLPPSAKPVVFRVLRGLQTLPFSTASAFAVEIEGHLFGVTAGHVMQNISQNPYMYFQTQEGRFATEKITSWRISNPMGTDVAVFEIPPKAKAHLQPLPLSTQRAEPLQMSSMAGFSVNEPLWLAKEEILFASSHRLLIRNNFQQNNTGMCGSPVMVNGQVAGVYVGAFPGGAPSAFLWPKLVQEFSSERLPRLHMAAPIENIMPLIHNLMQYNTTDEGILMKVLDHPVAILHPEDDLYSVSLIRNGNVQKIVRAEELTDPEHLEQFLELEENDILRVTIFPRYLNPKHSILRYEVNVSSGKVTRVKDNF